MDILFAPAWYWWVGVLGVGVAVFWTGNRRLDGGLKNLGGGLVLLGVVWGVVGYLVQTPKERAVGHTKAILMAYKEHDWGRFSGLLDPATTLERYGNREKIVAAAKTTVDNPGVTGVYVLSTEAEQTQSHVVVTVTIATPVERAMGRPVRSTWQFEYVDMGGEWVLATITPVGFEGESAEPILREMPGGR